MEVNLKIWEWIKLPRRWTWSVEGRAEEETPETSPLRTVVEKEERPGVRGKRRGIMEPQGPREG